MMRSLLIAVAAGGAARADLASRAQKRISDVFDERRARILNDAIGDEVTAAQLLAVTRLLGDNFIPTEKGEMGSAKGMCRVNETRPWDWRFDHGLHCNIVDEWYFAVGSHLETDSEDASRPPRTRPVPPTTDVPPRIPGDECYFPLPTDCAPGV